MQNVDYLLIGGGMTSAYAAQAIRERDSNGRIVIVGAENRKPYDRPPVSKAFLFNDAMEPGDNDSRPDEFYPDKQVELLLGVPAVAIDRTNKIVSLADGRQFQYRKLLLATGSGARKPSFPGADLPNVFTLRTVDDALALAKAYKSLKRAIIVGAGFLGMEAASGALKRGLETVVVETAAHPWGRFASPQLGGFMKSTYEAKGAGFCLGDEVASVAKSKTKDALSVSLKSGKTLQTDLVVACLGAVLNVELAQNCGLQADPRLGVVVDDHFLTDDPAIWAAGDIACFPDEVIGKRWHAEHYMNAQWQGETAGANMAGDSIAFRHVPYFFSDFLDLGMILRGDPEGWTRSRIIGDLAAGEFIELYSYPDGRLSMGIVVSHEGDKLDPPGDTIEKAILDRAEFESLTPAQLPI